MPAEMMTDELQVDEMILVSVDDHVVEPPDMFDNHLPAKYKDLAPKVIQADDGSDVWFYEDQQLPNIGLNAVAGKPPAEYGIDPTTFAEMRSGCYDIHDRVSDMNANGVLGSMCFPSFPQFCGQLFAGTEDKSVALAMVQAYNDWHIDEWCGSYPGRFIPLALPTVWDPEAMAAEVRRVAAKGCRAVTFSENPEKLGWPSFHNEHWDPFWRAVSEEGTVVCLHIGSSSQLTITSVEAPINVMITLQPMNIVQAAADVLWSRVLVEFPDVRFALSEGGIGWIPYFLERVDYVHEHHQAWTGHDLPGECCHRSCSVSGSSPASSTTPPGSRTVTTSASTPSPGSATTRTRTRPGPSHLSGWLAPWPGYHAPKSMR